MHVLPLLGRFRWKVRKVLWIIAPEVGHEDLELSSTVWQLRRVISQDVATFDGLNEQSENIVAKENATSCVRASSDV